MCKKTKCGICIVIMAMAAMIIWLLYQRITQSKEIQHDGSTLVKDMKSVYSDSKCVCKDARQMGMDVIDEGMQMKDDLVKEAANVKNSICGCEKNDEKG